MSHSPIILSTGMKNRHLVSSDLKLCRSQQKIPHNLKGTLDIGGAGPDQQKWEGVGCCPFHPVIDLQNKDKEEYTRSLLQASPYRSLRFCLRSLVNRLLMLTLNCSVRSLLNQLKQLFSPLQKLLLGVLVHAENCYLL